MRLGILSDAHGNVEAFRLGLKILADAHVKLIYFLGDAVGYIPDAGVVGLLHQGDLRSIRGNHDDMLVRRSASTEQDSIYRHHETLAALRAEELNFLQTLPLQAEFRDKNTTCLFVHGSPANALAGYVYPDSDLSQFSKISADVIFMGHTHRPFIRQENNKLFVNVGSCGLPRGDDVRASVCIFDTAGRDAHIIRYDISKCCARVLSRYALAPSVEALLRRCEKPDGIGQIEK